MGSVDYSEGKEKCDLLDKHIRSIYLQAKEYGIEELQDPSAYSDTIEEFCKEELELRSAQKIFDKNAKVGHTSVAVYEEVLMNDMEKIKENGKKSKRYTDLMAFIQQPQPSRAMENEDMEVEENVVDIDPFTKKPIEHPVRNPYCQHIYDKNSTIELIRTQGSYRCPVIGCLNKRIINEKELVEDASLIVLLQRARMKDD